MKIYNNEWKIEDNKIYRRLYWFILNYKILKE